MGDAIRSMLAEECPVCARLPQDQTAHVNHPIPVAADEWLVDDRIRGAFIGAAIGDGVDTSTAGGPAAAPLPGTLRTGGATQLGLFTAESLIRLELRAISKGIGPAWSVVQHGLHRWAWTQGSALTSTYASHAEIWPDGWLVRQHAMHRSASGFSSTLAETMRDRDVGSELAAVREIKDRPNTSSGRGALVRIGSAGLLFTPDYAFLAGATSASYSHGGADGYLSGGVLARVLAGLLAGEEADHARASATRELATWPHSGCLLSSLAGAPNGPSSPAASALSIGLATGLADVEPVAAIQTANEAGGTAAAVVAGLLAGARAGASRIPSAWRVAPDLIDVIEEVAQATSTANRAWVMNRELPGWTYGSDDIFEEHPVCRLLWPRFPGW